jgi:ribosomal protein S27AE
MEKYAVVQSQAKTKTASKANSCPRCGGAVARQGNVIVCTKKCGTKPFEEESD